MPKYAMTARRALRTDHLNVRGACVVNPLGLGRIHHIYIIPNRRHHKFFKCSVTEETQSNDSILRF